MSGEELCKHITAVPFRPFTINMTDGRRIPVFGRDFIMLSPSGRIVDVFQRDNDHDILASMLITGITFDHSTAPATTGELNP